MRALLVHPRFPTTYWGFQYSLPLVNKRATLPPLGLLTLAALLPSDWELSLVDMNVEELDDDVIREADVLFVGGMLVQAGSMREVIARAKAVGCKVIVGGPACTTQPELFADADHVFRGEAEGRVDEIVRAATTPRNATVRANVLAAKPDARPELALAPTPRFDLLDVSQYRSMSVQYSRGCPYACEFCDVIEIFGRVPRVKPAAQVLAELDALYALGYRGPLFFVDDNFIGNKRAVRALLPELEAWQRARGFPFALYTEASVNLAADPELLEAMVAAGFTSVFVGIETAQTEALAGANKKQNVGVDLTAAVDTITRAGLEVMGGFIVGFDSDGPDAFDAQRAFLARAPIPLAMVGVLTALPGTALWRRLAREGRLRDRSTGDQFGRANFEPAMGDEALLEGYASLLRELYSAEGYYARCEALVDRIGEPPLKKAPSGDDLAIVARAMMKLGLLGGRRRAPFLRLVARAARRGAFAFRWAITHAVMGEHMIRYTEEDVLPRIEAALASVRAQREGRDADRSAPPLRIAPLAIEHAAAE